MFDYEKAHLAALRSRLPECAVLLKTNGAFPLEAPCEIAAYGSGVRRTIRGGTGSGEVNTRTFSTIEHALSTAGFKITTGSWLSCYDNAYKAAKKKFIADLRKEAAESHENPIMYGMGKVMPEPEYELPLNGTGEAAIYVVSRISGEGNDRQPVKGDILLSDSEVRDILSLNERFERFMLVLNVGGVVDLSPVMEVKNILLLSQLGCETAESLADILLGRETPSGKLADTWAAWDDYFPMEDFGNHDNTRYREGVYVGYRYFDSVNKTPLFPFGYGCSYTTFAVEKVSAAGDESGIHVTAQVTNTGLRKGREVVQAYVTAPRGKLDQPWQTLVGFAKTAELQPGETDRVEIVFTPNELLSYDSARSAWILPEGKYILRVGTSSRDTQPTAILMAADEVITLQVKPCPGTVDFEDLRPAAAAEETLPDDLPVILMTAAEETISYSEPEVPESIRKLSDDKLVYANVGSFRAKALASVIGNASTTVAGAAGEITSELKNAGIRPLVMADGPAGIRINPFFYRDKNGAHGLGNAGVPESILEMLPEFVQGGMKLFGGSAKAPKGAKVEYQYCTAIPIGTALAQSWSTELAELCGDIVGEEMHRFGVQLWLAPALNIHRSIRCGRNFEYYSEDPLISGKMAAAVTRGVQQHPGCGVTIKHYACNNQETNRYGNNSMVSERALREIYLRGFGIAVHDAQPAAVMTSYNLLNGEHTAQRADLIRNILREEFGFDGVVMTDWVMSVMYSGKDIWPKTDRAKTAAAGGDLFMPGCKGDYQAILKGLKEGTVTRAQLEQNAARLYVLSQRLCPEESPETKA